MSSLILLTAVRYLVPLLFLFSVFLLTRGHNEPGGGFVGGLVAASAVTLYAISHTSERALLLVRTRPRFLVGIGLLLAASSGVVPVLLGRPFMTGVWSDVTVPIIGTLGTPVIFDIGVFLTVIGVVLMIIFALMEE
jgi:multicomponent Na+:H+ antiporter subunit B